MGTLNLTDPVNGTTADASTIANNNGAIKTVVNGGIDDTNIAAGAAISLSKLADPGVGKVVGSSSGAAAVYPPGHEWDRKTITADVTGITVSTEGTAASVITGNSVTYDGTEVRIEVFVPGWDGAAEFHGVFLCDSTVVGQTGTTSGSIAAGMGATLQAFYTPSAGAHTFAFKAFTLGGQTLNIRAGAGGSGAKVPGFLRVTKS